MTTVSSTTNYVRATPTTKPISYTTPPPPSTTSCSGYLCPTACVPTTTRVTNYLCDVDCLGKSTVTSTITVFDPPVTTSILCGPRYKRFLAHDEEPVLEKRQTCSSGPWFTTSSELPCTACSQYSPTTSVTKRMPVSTVTLIAPCMTTATSTSTKRPTSTIPLPTVYPCFWVCTNSVTRTTYYATATPAPGWDWCGQACPAAK
ncbi:SubName: Full=Uncharacterized protein {ECO:0000313/EMBL:CCA70117.1} [Serendipita indica DSM 11827]|uniref:Uncharacterized protein n=1 Tax=Serendipita indica (strain DSM 11827) TaxID=1109443 RepID=G4TFK1_SERID|nr:SubName: Full=Uncharacterized protein {ECO:0000313/EMBL:CCA70117.1} [Serendipita indica DSM 11827]CCA70117.1 hypothetical protein PIIN_04056 [Serendipita indica DSM 11827]